jgi:hypothetical protein
MARALTPEQIAKREALKNRTTEEVYQDAVKRGLESNVAAERVAAIKAYADERNPNITEMKDKVKIAEDRAAKAEANLVPVVTERDQAQGVLCIAVQAALQGSAAKAELTDLRMNFDSKVAGMRQELVAEAQAREWKAQRSESEARDTLQSAQRQFSNKGLEALLDAMRNLVKSNNIPEPDIWSLPPNVNPLLLTLWPDWTPIKASLFVGFMKSYPEPTEPFKQALECCLKARLPVHSRGMLIPLERLGIAPDPMPSELSSGPKPIEHLAEKIEVLTMMAQRWPGVMEEIQRRVDEEQVRRAADAMRQQTYELSAQQQELARQGYGRSEIGVQEKSATGYEGECIDPANCCCPKHNGLPAHLRPYEVVEPL